jgi:hypothetical protein
MSILFVCLRNAQGEKSLFLFLEKVSNIKQETYERESEVGPRVFFFFLFLFHFLLSKLTQDSSSSFIFSSSSSCTPTSSSFSFLLLFIFSTHKSKRNERELERVLPKRLLISFLSKPTRESVSNQEK